MNLDKKRLVGAVLLLLGMFISHLAVAKQVYVEYDFKIFEHKNYDYAPAVILDNNKYRMYWCAEDKGDQIFYSESATYSGPWSNPKPVFRSRNTTPGAPKSQQHFDGLHTCDPSVVKARGKYYLYYGGLSSEHGAPTNCKTRIGVAESPDGISWTRLNNGLPIVTSEGSCGKNRYGTGQPSVVFLDGYFYMVYTDTTGFAANKNNGAGLYVIRSKSPAFTNREVRTPRQWAKVGNGVRVTDHKLVDGFSADMMYSDAIDNFVVALHTNSKHTKIRFFDKNFSKTRPEMTVVGTWRDGPGLMKKPNGHALPSVSCNILPVPMVRARGEPSPSTWDLYLTDAYLELDNVNCSVEQLQRTYSGFVVRSPDKPLALITDSGRIQLENTAVLQNVNYSVVYVSNEIYERFNDLGAIKVSQKAVVGKGLPSALITTEGYRVQFSCIESIVRNKSSVLNISSKEFHNYPLGGEVFCRR